MKTSDLCDEYEILLQKLSKTAYFGYASVTHYLKNPELKDTGIKEFYKNHALILKDKVDKNNYIDVASYEHPNICGGVTEYLTKIKLAKRLDIDLTHLRFLGDINDPKYKNMSDEELAFSMYEPDIIFRCGIGYTPEIIEHKKLIIDKAIILSNVALNLINLKFSNIKSIDFHPYGHVFYDDKLAITGDSDLMINNCLIDFKTHKNASISIDDRAQLFAYSINKFMRDGKEYDKVYVLNPRYNCLCELIRK